MGWGSVGLGPTIPGEGAGPARQDLKENLPRLGFAYWGPWGKMLVANHPRVQTCPVYFEEQGLDLLWCRAGVGAREPDLW